MDKIDVRTDEELAASIEFYYKLSFEYEIYADQGQRWYQFVNTWAWHMGRETGIPIDKVAGIISALSPRNRWDKNLLDAHQILTVGERAKVHTTITNKKKALAILRGADIVKTLRGLKTINFYQNIVNPKNNSAVCIDIWMHRICADDLKLKAKVIGPKQYERMVVAVQTVAAKYHVLPQVVQATTWIIVRDLAKYGQLKEF